MSFLANPVLMNQIFLALIPTFAVSSQSLLDLALSALFLSLIFVFAKKRQILVIEKIGIEWAFLGYMITIVLGFWLNASPDAEWLDSAIKFSWVLNLYILIFGLQTTQLDSTKILKALSAGTLIPTLYSLASYMYGVDLITGRNNHRITGMVNSATYHAHGNAIIFVFLACCLYFSFKKLKLNWKIFAVSSFLLLGTSILLTFTRGIWISIFVSSAIILLILDRKKFLVFIAGTLILGGIAFQTLPKLREGVDPVARAASVEERVSFIQLNLQMWKQYPLLGIGYGENLRRCREYWDRPEWNKPADYNVSHAHNQYLNVLSTTGLFGLFFFAMFFLYFIYKNIKLLLKTSSELSPERWALLIGCLWAQIEFAIACLTDVSFEYAKIRTLILIVWALVVVIEKKPAVVKE